MLPRFCHFWQMTPVEFDALEWTEYEALSDYQERYQREIEKLNKQMESARRGRA